MAASDNRKDRKDLENETQKKEELDALLDELDLSDSPDNVDVSGNIAKAEDVLGKKRKEFIDFYAIRQQVTVDCDTIINDLSSMYLSEDMVKIPYVQSKMMVNKREITHLLFRLKLSDFVAIKLMEQLDAGDVSPRMFEAYSNMERAASETSKTLSQFMVFLESSYKNIRLDILESGETSMRETITVPEDETTRSRGTKDFLKELHDDVEDADISD